VVWDECQACFATGKVGSEACVECSGWGWHLIG
jgi:DnaJ-class molecular chaperone